MLIPTSFLPLLILGVVLAFLRSSYTKVAEHEPTPAQMIIPQPPFCAVPEENLEKLFYYDLGGTYCLCEKQWSNKEYWQKTLSGMAFNFPHLLNGFMAQLVFGSLFWVSDPDSPVWLTRGAGGEWAERADGMGAVEVELKPMNDGGGAADEGRLGMVDPNHPRRGGSEGQVQTHPSRTHEWRAWRPPRPTTQRWIG